MVQYVNALDHVGLLRNEPPGTTGLLFIQSGDGNHLNDSISWHKQEPALSIVHLDCRTVDVESAAFLVYFACDSELRCCSSITQQVLFERRFTLVVRTRFFSVRPSSIVILACEDIFPHVWILQVVDQRKQEDIRIEIGSAQVDCLTPFVHDLIRWPIL